MLPTHRSNVQRGGPGRWRCVLPTRPQASVAGIAARIAHSSAGDCVAGTRSPPGKAPRRSAASPPPSRWGGPRVVGLEWSSPYRLKPTMMSDQAWMDLAAVGGTMQKQGWRQGRVRFKVCAPNLAERKEGEKSMKRRNRIPLCGIADARMGFATVSSFDS